jgi:hypothetical protein
MARRRTVHSFSVDRHLATERAVRAVSSVGDVAGYEACARNCFMSTLWKNGPSLTRSSGQFDLLASPSISPYQVAALLRHRLLHMRLSADTP